MKFFRFIPGEREKLLKKLHDKWRKIALIVILRVPSGSFQSSSFPGFYDWKNESGSLMMMRRKVNSACIWFSLSHTLLNGFATTDSCPKLLQKLSHVGGN
jgi:hypothetical protein